MRKELSEFVTDYRCWFRSEEAKHKKILERRIEKRFIDPLLMNLGYDHADIRRQVVVDIFAGSGAPVHKGKVDYVIVDPPYVRENTYSRRSLSAHDVAVGIIEAKRSDVSIDDGSRAHHQMISYKNTPQLKNVKWMVLTNGRKMNLYSSLNEFQAIRIDLMEWSIPELVTMLRKLGRKNLARYMEQLPEVQKRAIEECFGFNRHATAMVFC